MNRSLRIAAAAALALAGSAVPPAALAQVGAAAASPPAVSPADSLFRATTLNLDAHGSVRIAPDMATVSLGVQVQAATAAQAMAADARRMTAVLAALKAAGIAEKDIQTSGLSLSAQYAYDQGQTPRLTGYQAANQVTVLVRDLARLGPAVDAVVGAGANQVNGISFGLADPTAAENAAREAAVKALADKAALYARATGYRVARLVSLSEGGGYAPPAPVPMLRMVKAMAPAAPTPVESGELEVRIDVSGVYELAK